MSLQVWSQEGEVIVDLIDLVSTTTQEQVQEGLDSLIGDELHSEIIADWCGEGDIVTEHIPGIPVVKKSILDYAAELKAEAVKITG